MFGSVIAATAGAALALVPVTASYAAPASQTGCPASNQVLVVADLTEMGYGVPAVVDGEGNNNGKVCGKPLNPVVQERVCPAATCQADVIYLFRDDSLTR